MDEQRADRLEDLRQLEHFLPVGFAFLLPFMEFSTILLMALLAILYAVLISPRLVTTRAEERQRGFSTGKLTYALSVLGLILVFHDKLYLAAATWGILAAGDSVSNLLGRRYGRRPLPYNPQKTLVGLLGFGIAGGLAAWILLLWNLDGPQGSWPILLFLSFLVSFTCAFFESLPSPFDD
ncbi:MAG TPA: phosphatidate cytidylyltransferase, partial [Acidobacteriota bacterium]|nr:phosphatidate cytidylyltransferase [Acidobacteriota bacterium]